MSQTLPDIAHGKSSTGLDANLAGALSYLFAPIGGIVFYLIEKDSPFVRFHAAQSIVFGIAAWVVGIGFNVISGVLSQLPGIGWLVALAMIPLALLVWAASVGAWAFLVYKAFSGQKYEAPVIAPYARQLASRAPDA